MDRGHSWSDDAKKLGDEQVCKQERLQEKPDSEEFPGGRLAKLRRHTVDVRYGLELKQIQNIILELDKRANEVVG